MSTLMLYKNPIPLDKNKHKALKLSPQKNFNFAKEVNSLPLAGIEFFKAGRNFPIFFLKGADGKFVPIVLLSLRSDNHDLEGDWRGYYIPVFVRRYPFVLTDGGLVAIDEESEFLQENKGDPLFDDKGGNTETLKKVIGFLRTADAAYKATEQFSEALAQKELFAPFSANVKYETVKIKLEGLYTISEKKFHELDKETIGDWFSKGWVAWAYGQMNSIDALPSLAKLQYEKEKMAAKQA